MWYVVVGLIVMPPLTVFIHGFGVGLREGLPARRQQRFKVVWPDCEEGSNHGGFRMD
jgi:hypothetical protein